MDRETSATPSTLGPADGPAAPGGATVDHEPRSSPSPKTDAFNPADQEAIFEAFAAWDERFRLGEDPPIESLGLSDPALVQELARWIAEQKRLYAVMQIQETTPDGRAGALETLAVFPGHETLGMIGQGGMGVVYKARDKKLGRVVAIKTMAEVFGSGEARSSRFLAEAEAVARLKHPNVVSIYAIGEFQGRPYFSLEFAEGGSLSQRLARGPMSATAAARLIELLAHAVHAAHQAGIVHRDLKPSNVLLTADGVPKISDFGLAKLLDSDSVRTLSGEALGTPSYMAPEQASGNSREVGPAADIHALGAILYHTMTGRPPFLGESTVETLALVVSTEVVPPRRLRPDMPADLETICLKCLEKSPARRYATAQELAEDLERFRSGAPIRARRLGPVERLAKWAARHPWQTGLAATVFLALAVVMGLTYRHNFQLRAEIGRTQAKAAEARRNYAEARSTIGAMLGRLDDRQVAGSPRLLNLRRNQREDALAFFDRVLSEAGADDPVIHSDITYMLNEASALQHSLGQTQKAEISIRRALGLVERIRADNPSAVRYIRLHVDCLLKLCAYLDQSKEKHDEALSAGHTAIELAERVVAALPDNVECQDELALCHHNYATALATAGRLREAASHFQAAVQAREHIPPAHLPGVTERLAMSLTSKGVMHWQSGEFTVAEADFRRAGSLLEQGAPATNTKDNAAIATIAIGQLNACWGGMLLTTGHPDEAIARSGAGLSSIEAYLRAEPDDREARDLCLKLHGNRAYALGALGRHGEASQDWERVVQLSSLPVPVSYRVRLAIELLLIGETARALDQAKLVNPSSEISGDDRYNLGCLFGLLATNASKDSRAVPEERVRLVESFIGEALVWLKSASSAGFFQKPANCDHARKDPDLAILRDRAEFQKLIESHRDKR
jgi:tetratricopeptide (TPR) repeat protein/tRNA A-37 threonylcarbamoyl transferase component Bud32